MITSPPLPLQAVTLVLLCLFPFITHHVVHATTAAAPVNLICVGGSSGMGKACALETVRQGGAVLLVSRSAEKLAAAAEDLRRQVPTADVTTRRLDTTDETAVAALAATLDDDHEEEDSSDHPQRRQWDALVVTAAGRAAHGPVTDLPTSDARAMVESKLWGAYHCAKYLAPKLREGGCIVLCAGVLNRRPGRNCAPLAIANGALEGLTRSLALELGPRLRVNCLSPGFCDTERFDHMEDDRREGMFRSTAASLPLQKIGTPEDMGKALYYLMTAPFVTGVVLDVDGGHTIRQYASRSNDPMRTE